MAKKIENFKFFKLTLAFVCIQNAVGSWKSGCVNPALLQTCFWSILIMTQNSPATSEIQILNALSQTTLIIQLFNTKLSKNQMYSGDLNSEHLNGGYIWLTNFYLFAIQMPGNSWLFKPWPEYRTKSCFLSHDLNNELKIHHSSHQSRKSRNLSVKQLMTWIVNY